MKNIRAPFIFLVLLFFSIAPVWSQHSIIGNDEVCYSECHVYSLNGGVGGPYLWKSTGEFKDTNQGATVEICWTTIGSNEISLVDFSANIGDQIQKLEVDVRSVPTPDIIPPKYPECERKDSIWEPNGETDMIAVQCISACSESVAFYSFEDNQGETVEWDLEGGTILSTTSEGITVRWDPSGSGFIKLTETNDIGCTDSVYYCVDILEPLAVDISAVSGGANSINVCVGQEVYLQGTGDQEATSFEWDLGNGTYYTGANVTTSYDVGGTYDVMLIGSSECKCFDTTYYQIIVDANPGPEITCIGTTCGNEEHTYYAGNMCGTYSWNVSGNGSITDGGTTSDNFVTINWNNGPVGTVGLSTSGCAEATCSSETIVQIPIIDGTAAIEGPQEVCKKGYSAYSIQYYNGTDYTWNVTGNGYIIEGWGTNQIVVEWQEDPQSENTAQITVEYENCYLECGGQADLTVTLKPEFEIGVPQEVCQDRTTYFSATEGWNNAIVSWTITSPSGVVTTFTDESWINSEYPELGIHTVVAVDNNDNYCNDEIKAFFTVVEKPPTPAAIEGPLVICLNEFYNYSVDIPFPGVEVTWRFRDGSIYKNISSKTVSFEWTSSGPYEITVWFSREDIYCRSEDLQVFPELAENATISGSSASCVDEVETYSVGATNGSQPVWSITPSDAGSIVHNPDNTIDVMWHTSGTHQITTDYCGANLIYNVDVAPLGTNTLIYEEEICPGSVTPLMCVIPSTSTVEIRDESDVVIGNSTTVNIPNGKYEVEITSVNGCVEVIPVVIDTFLPPSVRVSSPDENAFCLPHPNLSIVALNTNAGYTFEWFHNNVSMGITTPTISTNQYGGYHVQVTDTNGCTAISNVHRLYEWCEGDPPPGTCTGGGGGGVLNHDEIYLQCNNLQFTVNGSGISSTSFTWNFSDPDSGADNISTETSPIHEFSSAGYFYVFVQGNVPSENGVDIFAVPAAPRFDYERACAGNAVQFRNHSTFIPGMNITNYNWDFGDPASGTDNTSTLENPQHTYATPGTYTVSLEIQGNNGCLSTYYVDVLVEPGPLAEYLVPSSACTNDGVLFEAFQSDDIYSYEWDFDDMASGSSNTSMNPSPIHTFSASGIYNVSLSVSDANGCIQTITKAVDVTTTTLSGDIVADKSIPICYTDDVNLTAPAGGSAYLWSNGSTDPTINVTEPGVYSVTITENTGCDYVPEPFNVAVDAIKDARIRGVHVMQSFNEVAYYDSLEICQGEEFYVNTAWIFQAEYDWTPTASNLSYISSNNLNGFGPGRHEFNVTITDPSTGCDIEGTPLTVIIHPLPQNVQISGSSSLLCEGEVHTLTVDNPDPNLVYYWNNGDSGLSTRVSASGSYKVTAINKNGCEQTSNGIYIAPLPNANRINVGCMEACFPDTICSPAISGAASYQWLFDGSPMTGVNANSNDLIADQAGEYQLVVENYNGCRDTSEVLYIEAEPSDQSVAGIVFIDANNNGVYDSGDELLSGVPVNLYSGTNFEETITTDAAGYYSFDPVMITNPRIEIDTAGLGLNLTGGLLEGDIDFLDCLEDKIQDFPLIRDCAPSVQTVDFFTCPDETIVINSIVLQEGDTWTFDDTSSAGCDSTTFVNVLAFPEPEVNLTTHESCQDVNNGMLDIAIMSGTGLQFAVDNNSTFTTNLQFDNLAPGMHTLWITDENNCMLSYTFDIEAAAPPLMNAAAQNSCLNSNTGVVQVIPTQTGNYQYSIDGTNFGSNNMFTDLAPGAYTIYVQEDNLCIYEYPFVIVANPEPQFDLNTIASCSIGATGSLDITALDAGTFTYSLDNTTFVSTTTFSNLAPGTSTLYVQEVDGCTHQYPFEILATEEPELDIFTVNTCEGENQGSINIAPLTSGNYEYSLDGVTYSNNLEFNNLTEGTYTIYLLEEGQCNFSFSASIVPQPEPIVTIDTEDACIGESNGNAIISSLESPLLFSLDQINYTMDNTLNDLPQGMHTVYIQTENGCVHPIEFEVFEAQDLEVEFIDPLIDCSVQSTVLAPMINNAEGPISYSWDTGESDSTLIVQNSGQYSLSVSDKCSTLEHTWDITLEEITEDQPIYFPNIFSPNQDGVNECFVPVPNPKTTILSYRLIIFDRWGNKFFETTDMSECWDGKYNGKDARTGVFVYRLDMEYTYCVDVETFTKFGDVTVVH